MTMLQSAVQFTVTPEEFTTKATPMGKIIPINKHALIKSGNVIGCPNWTFADVWVRCSSLTEACDKYASMTRFETHWYGMLTTRRYTERTPSLPVGKDRSLDVTRHYTKLLLAEARLLKRFGVTASEKKVA